MPFLDSSLPPQFGKRAGVHVVPAIFFGGGGARYVVPYRPYVSLPQNVGSNNRLSSPEAGAKSLSPLCLLSPILPFSLLAKSRFLRGGQKMGMHSSSPVLLCSTTFPLPFLSPPQLGKVRGERVVGISASRLLFPLLSSLIVFRRSVPPAAPPFLTNGGRTKTKGGVRDLATALLCFHWLSRFFLSSPSFHLLPSWSKKRHSTFLEETNVPSLPLTFEHYFFPERNRF